MEKILLLRCGELMLKGLNRPYFEKKLTGNIKEAVKNVGKSRVIKSQGRIYVKPIDQEYDYSKAIKNLSKVFGIVSLSLAWEIESDLNVIKEIALKIAMETYIPNIKSTFKVDTRRADKSFPLKSPDVSSIIGEHILKNIEGIKVDVINPDFTVFIEIRESTYIYTQIIPAKGGLPSRTNGKAVLLLSGGIDSPVAGWMMAKRGVELEAVHFHSYPYTSERSKEKVIELLKRLEPYCGNIKLNIVPFTKIQMSINENCPSEASTIIMRRIMMRIAEKIAFNCGADALITGESLGQVASQTIQSLRVTNASVSLPVFRPLIGMDKNDVVLIARDIDTFEISILPYEDCCTVFTPKHPNTKPVLEDILKMEEGLDWDKLIEEAFMSIETI